MYTKVGIFVEPNAMPHDSFCLDSSYTYYMLKSCKMVMYSTCFGVVFEHDKV